MVSNACAREFSLIFLCHGLEEIIAGGGRAFRDWGARQEAGEAMSAALLLSIALAQLDASPVPQLNLLVGLKPASEKTANAERMNDGQAADPGDNWQSVLTSVIEKEGSVTWDFGAPRDFEGVWIQADNNDVYVLSVSDDGQHFTTAWESSTVDNAGMQTRTSATARGRGRYLKLTAKGGDGAFSVSELAVFANAGDLKAYVPSYVRTAPPPQPLDGNWVVIAVVLAGVVLLVRRIKPPEAAPEAEAPKAEKKEEPPAGKS